MTPMQPSDACRTLVKQFEGLRLAAYRDQRGIVTIGWGHTGSVDPGAVIDLQQADAYLDLDLSQAAARVIDCLRFQPNQNQFDALVSFEFNTGGLRGSTMQRLLNQDNPAGAADQFSRWNKVEINGQLVPSRGLTQRRAAEHDLFLSAVPV